MPKMMNGSKDVRRSMREKIENNEDSILLIGKPVEEKEGIINTFIIR